MTEPFSLRRHSRFILSTDIHHAELLGTAISNAEKEGILAVTVRRSS